MKKFDLQLNIRSTIKPIGFIYGDDCFGPVVEYRKLDDIRQSLMDQNCNGPETVYAIAMDVGKKAHFNLLKELHLLYGVVTYAQGSLGKEPIRSQGHVHRRSVYGRNWSTPEVYQIWSGKAVIYMQEFAGDNPGRCFAVYAEPGDVVIVPPAWGHATISADAKTPLTFGAWCDLDYGNEYEKVRAHNGLAWYPLIGNNNKLNWYANPFYKKSKLIEKTPNDYDMLGIKQQQSIYAQFEKEPELFLFVPKPFIREKVWERFIP
jgi:glucose-6-phosphate isomerase